MNQAAKKLIIGWTLALMPFLAYAATTTNVLRQQIKTERQEIKEEAQTKRKALIADTQSRREDFKNKIQLRVDELKKHFGEVRAKRIEQFFDNMVEKMENAVDQLNKSDDRTSRYLDKLSARGKDVGVYEANLDAARLKIVEAQTALENAKTKFSDMALSANPKEKFKEVKNLIQIAVQKIKSAHKSLIEVVRSVKGLSDRAATTTSQ